MSTEKTEDYKAISRPPMSMNSDNVGLDTIQWRLSNGNLKIQQEMEEFIKNLQMKYVGASAYPLK